MALITAPASTASTFTSTTSTTQNPLDLIKIEHNQSTIEKIKKLRAEGFKLCLFIGRWHDQPLPNPTNNKEIWVSLDPTLRTKEELEALSPQRLHLILSCNDSEEMAKIQRLFSIGVVDQSTMKFFKPGIVDELTSVLTGDLESSLTFESFIENLSPDPNTKDWEFDHHWNGINVNEGKFSSELIEWHKASKTCLDNFVKENGGVENLDSTSLYQEFILTLPEAVVQESSKEELLTDFGPWLSKKKNILYPLQKYIPLARQKTVEYLDSLYENVELKLNTPYPYWTRYKSDNDNFFVAKGPLEGVKIRNNLAVIEKIKQLITQGKKLNLFIGRNPHEPLPQEMDPNVVWVSLDLTLRKSKELSPDRLHLILSCNDSEEMAKIQRLFSTVIVDQSTWKFFKPGILDRLIPLLTVHPENSLIFESNLVGFKTRNIEAWEFDHVFITIPKKEIDEYENRCSACVKDFLEEIGGSENLRSNALFQEYVRNSVGERLAKKSSLSQLLSGFQGWLPNKKGIESPNSKYTSAARQKTLNYLQARFDSAELKLDAPYPYWTNYSSGKDDFFVAKGPKA